jgi:hypothetical protein
VYKHLLSIGVHLTNSIFQTYQPSLCVHACPMSSRVNGLNSVVGSNMVIRGGIANKDPLWDVTTGAESEATLFVEEGPTRFVNLFGYLQDTRSLNPNVVKGNKVSFYLQQNASDPFTRLSFFFDNVSLQNISTVEVVQIVVWGMQETGLSRRMLAGSNCLCGDAVDDTFSTLEKYYSFGGQDCIIQVNAKKLGKKYSIVVFKREEAGFYTVEEILDRLKLKVAELLLHIDPSVAASIQCEYYVNQRGLIDFIFNASFLGTGAVGEVEIDLSNVAGFNNFMRYIQTIFHIVKYETNASSEDGSIVGGQKMELRLSSAAVDYNPMIDAIGEILFSSDSLTRFQRDDNECNLGGSSSIFASGMIGQTQNINAPQWYFSKAFPNNLQTSKMKYDSLTTLEEFSVDLLIAPRIANDYFQNFINIHDWDVSQVRMMLVAKLT